MKSVWTKKNGVWEKAGDERAARPAAAVWAVSDKLSGKTDGGSLVALHNRLKELVLPADMRTKGYTRIWLQRLECHREIIRLWKGRDWRNS